MQSSARNQLKGKVTKINHGSVNDTIKIELAGGDRLVATITSESTQTLGLSTGTSVIALIKAPWVMVATHAENVKVSARNQLNGVIEHLKTGAVNTEVGIRLKGGTVITAMITNDSAEALQLHQGQSTTAIVKASHVILAVAN
ncbi:Molybdenum-pterin binding protein [gamma proteobacterium HdN1]|nr:Molybdenum-pterin binding protein [gamma proteobacterium HdN1]